MLQTTTPPKGSTEFEGREPLAALERTNGIPEEPTGPMPLPDLDVDAQLQSFQEQGVALVSRGAIAYRPPTEPDRLTILWHAKFLILLAAVVVGGAVYLISNSATPVYTSSTMVGVTAASTPGGSAEDVALASNDLAAQDAPLVTADGVLSQASKKLGVPASSLAEHVTEGTVDAQNIIQITVQSSDPAKAQEWANGIAVAFQMYLVARAEANSSALQNSVNQQAAPLNLQITQLQQQIAANTSTSSGSTSLAAGSASLAELQSEESQLTELLGTRATLIENTALAIASQRPNVEVLQAASAPAKVSPRPLLYAVIAAIAALLLAAELAIFAARRRASSISRR
jgi:capsular polysaccharide biosynthesis protein